MTKHILPNISDEGKWVGQNNNGDENDLIGNLKYHTWFQTEVMVHNKKQ